MAESSQPSRERLVAVEKTLEHMQSNMQTWMVANDRKQDGRHTENHALLTEIKEQTIKTNGRVDKLESWRDKIQGGWWVIALVAGVIGFVIEKLLK